MSRRQALVGTVNGGCVPLAEMVPCPPADLVGEVTGELARGGRLCAWFGVRSADGVSLVAVVAHDRDGVLLVGRSLPTRAAFPALTARHAQAHLFEREIHEQHGFEPQGHPWLKPVRSGSDRGPGTAHFFRVDGAEVHEVAVGPVHAGIIEPGHFRFQCHGEEVLHLEIALGYQHRGVEAALVGGPHKATLVQMETVAGDATIAHATAFATVMEALGGTEAPPRAHWLRAVALELERLANHAGDIGALAGDVAYLPTAAACGRIRGEFLNLTALVCGNRFGRRLVRPGGCRHDLEDERRGRLADGLALAVADTMKASDWLWASHSARSRFEGVGVVTGSEAGELGLVGVAARASGLARDVRRDHPAGWYRSAQLPVEVGTAGDVYSRCRVRWLELQGSAAFIRDQLAAAPAGPVAADPEPPRPDRLAVSLVESWRGEACHVGITDGSGCFLAYKIVDPSFHNWSGLALAMRGQAIADFPICNKSFNLSYCGHDL